MSEDRFYHAGCEARRGLKGAFVPLRRALRRILRPMFVRLAEQVEAASSRLDRAEERLDGLDGRLDRTSVQMRSNIAFGWDYVAMVRRLAAIEDHVARLQGEASSKFAEGQLTLPFPEQGAVSRAQAS